MQNERSSGESVAKNSRSKVWKAKNKFLSGYRNTALVAYPKNTSYCHIAFAAEILRVQPFLMAPCNRVGVHNSKTVNNGNTVYGKHGT